MKRVTAGDCGVLAAVLAVFVMLAARFFDREVDDVYIDLLFGRNLAEFGIFALDVQGAPIEGFSSPINILLHGLGYSLGMDNGLLVAKVRALVCACLALVVVYFLLRRLTSHPAVPWVGAGLLAVTPSFQYWGVAGLETPIYALLLVWAVQLLMRPQLTLLSAVPLGLLAITRPEGPMMTILGVGFVVLRTLRGGRPQPAVLRRLGLWLATIAVISAPYHVFRWSYFHALFPNTYYAKVNDYVSPWYGVRYVSNFALEGAPWLLLGLPLAWAARRKAGAGLGLLWVFVLAQLTVAVRAGGDWMPFNRFAVHVLPLLTVAAGCGLDHGLRILARLTRPSRQLLPASTSPAAASQPTNPPSDWISGLSRWAVSLAVVGGCLMLFQRSKVLAATWEGVPDAAVVSDARDYREVAASLVVECERRGKAPASAVVALEPVGIVPFFSRLRVLDLSGKTNRAIGSAPQRFGIRRVREQELWVADLVFAQGPDFFCKSAGMYSGHQQAVLADPRFPLWYERVDQVNDWIDIYARRSTPLAYPQPRFVNRPDALDLLTPSTGSYTPMDPAAAAQQVQAALERGEETWISMQHDSPACRVEPLLDLGKIQVRGRNNYALELALVPGSSTKTILLAGLPLELAPSENPLFELNGPTSSVVTKAPAHLRVDCASASEWNLCGLRPLDVSAQGLCLIECTLRLERDKGQGTGLFWSVHNAVPGTGTMIDAGNVLVHGVQDGWTTVGVVVPLEPSAVYLSVAVGGAHNKGSVALVRELRVVAFGR